MAPSARANQARRDAEAGSTAALTALGVWHLEGEEGLQQDHVKAAVLFREAADLGDAYAQGQLATCYYIGGGVEENCALAAEWGHKSADHGNAAGQYILGRMYARGEGVKKDLPLGKTYLELCAAQGVPEAVELLRELRKCAFCGQLDVHHMICAWCRNVRYCGGTCQLRHWQRLVDPHKPHCGRRREVAGALCPSSDPTAVNDKSAREEALEVAETVAAAEAAVEATMAVFEARAAAAAATVTVAVAATEAVEAAPTASKKEKKKKAKLVSKMKAADTAERAAVEAATLAGAALEVAKAVLQAAP